jgi:hypothetical protein
MFGSNYVHDIPLMKIMITFLYGSFEVDIYECPFGLEFPEGK